MLMAALRQRPGDVPLFMAFANDGPAMTFTTGPRPGARVGEMTLHSFDRVTGWAVPAGASGAVTAWLLQLHTDLFLGLKGELFLGAMGLLFVAALVPGTVLYAPFMRKLDFGTLRSDRSVRLKWLDHHNLIGIVALAWMAVVGVTGVVNSLVTPITTVWQADELAEMTRRYAGQPPVPPSAYGSLDTAMATARRAVPGMAPQFIAFNQEVNAANTLRIPVWTRFDPGARYVTAVADRPLTLRFTVDNVANNRYWASAFDTFSAASLQGAPRTFKLSASIDL